MINTFFLFEIITVLACGLAVTTVHYKFNTSWVRLFIASVILSHRDEKSYVFVISPVPIPRNTAIRALLIGRNRHGGRYY